MTELSDELLVAYVDGQLARKQNRAVEKVLEQDDVIAARVEALKHAHARLEAAFEAILAGEEMEISAVQAPVETRGGLGWGAVAGLLTVVGLVSALGVGIAGYGWPVSIPGLTLGGMEPAVVVEVAPDWREEVTRAHALLSRASFEVGLESQGNYDLVAFQLSQILGANPKIPNLEAQGFRFVRAQMLRAGEEPLAQILYLGAEGAPLALYAKTGEGSETLIPGRIGAIRTVTWAEEESGVAYLLAGEVDEPLLMRIATRIKVEPAPPLPNAPKPYTPVNSALDR